MAYTSEPTPQLAGDVLRRRKWLGVTVFVLAASALAPLPLVLPDVYRATTTVVVERPETPQSVVRSPVTDLETRLAGIRQEVLSRHRLSELIDRFDLYADDRRDASRDELIDRMRRDIGVESTSAEQAYGRRSTIGVAISYVSLDPQTAAAVANALAALYVDRNTDMRARQTGRTADFLEDELAAAKVAVDRAQRELDEFRRRHVGELPGQAGLNLASLERLNGLLRLNNDQQVSTRERRTAMRDQLAKAEADVKALAEAPDQELAGLRAELREKSGQLTERHPEIVHLRARIAALEAGSSDADPVKAATRTTAGRLVARLQTSLGEADAELERLRQEERQVRAELSAYDRRLETTPLREREEEQLRVAHAGAKAHYDSLLARFEEAQLAESFEQTNAGEAFRILEQALPPTLPIAPNRARLLFMVALLAVGAAVGAMVVAEHLDTSFHTVDEVRQFTRVPVLAAIPNIEAGRGPFRRAAWNALTMTAILGVCAGLASGAAVLARENAGMVWILVRGPF